MRYYLAGLLALAALTISVSSVEARGRCRGGCGGGIFQGKIFQGGFRHSSSSGCNTTTAGHVHTAECGATGCNVAGTWPSKMPVVEEGITSPRQIIPQQAIQVRDSQGRIYYLVPQNQYEKLQK